MAETTYNQTLNSTEDYRTAVEDGIKKLSQIHEQMERDQEEINWLKTETQKSIDRTKEFLKLK
ncbi:MAG: hypothetical protein ACR2MG_00745 [Pyrinomonadaceae bacterium]